MTQTAKEYACALFELAGETNDGSEKKFADALSIILNEFKSNPEYIDLLSSPNIPIGERRAVLEKAFAGYVPEYVLSFTQLLCDNGHIKDFEIYVKEYEQLVKAFSSVSNARVVSMIPLTDSEKEALLKKLEKISGHHVTAKYEIDESLLGGMVIYMDDTVIDGSLKHQLKEVKEVIGI